MAVRYTPPGFGDALAPGEAPVGGEPPPPQAAPTRATTARNPIARSGRDRRASVDSMCIPPSFDMARTSCRWIRTDELEPDVVFLLDRAPPWRPRGRPFERIRIDSARREAALPWADMRAEREWVDPAFVAEVVP